MRYLLTLILLLISVPLWALSPAVLAVVGTNITTSSSCTTSEIVPTATTTSTNWAAYPSGTILDAINELIVGRDTNDLVSIADNVGSPLTMRFALPGDCDVTGIRAEVFIDGSAASLSVNVDISNDNSTWESPQSIALPDSTPAENPKTFSGLSWTTPTYCYVRITPTSATYSSVRLYGLSITVNP